MSAYITPYIGFGNQTSVYIFGRVTRRPMCERSSGTFLQVMRCTLHNFFTTPIKSEVVVVTFNNTTYETTTNASGEFSIKIPTPPIAEDTSWHTVTYKIKGRETTYKNTILIDSIANEYGIISDIDDTLLKTQSKSTMRAVLNTITLGAQKRKPVPGTPLLCQKFTSGYAGKATNPIFYVSSSPIQLYTTIFNFLLIHNFPKGPILLRENNGLLDILKKRKRHAHKREKIISVLDTHPELSFVLLGDSGQRDTAIYYDIAQQYPTRIRAIYIRDAGNTQATAEIMHRIRSLHIPALLTNDTEAMLKHARAHSLITE